MPSHLSTIGFPVENEEDIVALANQLGPLSTAISTKSGGYFCWRGEGGEEIWLQTDHEDELIAFNPHFTGEAIMEIQAVARVVQNPDFPLDVSFHAWANPGGAREDAEESSVGDYPFLFDCPDAETHSELVLPARLRVQLAAFAHEITCYRTEDNFKTAQEEQDLHFATKSFIPAGLFSAEGEQSKRPDSTAVLTGLICKVSKKHNTLTNRPFYWLLVDSYGGQFDVVVDEELIQSEEPKVGGVVSGSFWLSGRILTETK